MVASIVVCIPPLAGAFLPVNLSAICLPVKVTTPTEITFTYSFADVSVQALVSLLINFLRNLYKRLVCVN